MIGIRHYTSPYRLEGRYKSSIQ